MEHEAEEGRVMNAGERTPRKKRPPPERRYPAKSRAVKKLYKDPVYRARRLIVLQRATKAQQEKKAYRLNVPDGWTRGQAEMQCVYDGIRADLIMDKMKAEGMIEDTKPGDFEVIEVEVAGNKIEVRVPKTEAGMAEAALRQAIIGAISPLTARGGNQLGYIRTVLEWTKKKPATDINQNLSSEEWLEAALKDNEESDD